LLFITFSHKKWRQFKPVYKPFQIWQRFTKWKRICARSPHDKFIALSESEVSLAWKVRENMLNARRTRQMRANQASQKRIGAKAVRALYNLSIMTMARHAVLDRSDRFRNRHSQALGHRAWLKYMQQRSRENQFLRDIVRAWYGRIYRARRWRVTTDLAGSLRQTYHLGIVFNLWYRVTQMERIERARTELKIQGRPSTFYMILFLMRGDYELFFSALCFRSWIRFGRARARWKRYVLWASEPKAEMETQHLVLCELKRAAQFKLVQRMFTERPKFFPRKPYLSLELTLRHIEEDREEERRTAAHWTFETAMFFAPRQIPDESLTYTTLVRSLLVRIHQCMKFSLCEFGGEKPDPVRANPYFERLRTFPELTSRIALNTATLRDRMYHKLRRDRAILSGLMSHMAAGKLAQSAVFSTQPSSSCLESVEDMTGLHTEVNIFPDLHESVEALFKKEQASPRKVPNPFAQVKANASRAFDARLRDPHLLLMAPTIRTGFDAESKGEGDKKSRPAQNQLIDPFANDSYRARMTSSIISMQEIFNLPRFKEVLQGFQNALDMMSALQRFFLDCSNVQLDLTNPLSIARSSSLYTSVDQHKRRRMMRNIATLIAEYAGFGENPGVAIRINAPRVITEAIDGVLTVHTALRSTSLAQYCDECPFTKRAAFTDQLLQSMRMRVMQALRMRFPGLEFIGVGAGARFRLPSFGFPAGVRVEQTMTSNDASLAVFLLPMILQFDAVLDYANDEIIGHAHPQG
jgi:hypothetical protein